MPDHEIPERFSDLKVMLLGFIDCLEMVDEHGLDAFMPAATESELYLMNECLVLCNMISLKYGEMGTAKKGDVE